MSHDNSDDNQRPLAKRKRLAVAQEDRVSGPLDAFIVTNPSTDVRNVVRRVNVQQSQAEILRCVEMPDGDSLQIRE